jgi:hypothetical protein
MCPAFAPGKSSILTLTGIHGLGKGLGLALTLLARLVERLAAPTHEFRHLVGVGAVRRTLDAIAMVVQKPQGHGKHGTKVPKFQKHLLFKICM